MLIDSQNRRLITKQRKSKLIHLLKHKDKSFEVNELEFDKTDQFKYLGDSFKEN